MRLIGLALIPRMLVLALAVVATISATPRAEAPLGLLRD